jgi:hypothetical protein
MALGAEAEGSFVSVLPMPPALLAGLRLLEEAALLARETPFGPDMSAAIDALMAQTVDQVNAAAEETAKVAERAIVEEIKRTRVRPPTSGWNQMFEGYTPAGARKTLEEGIKAEPMLMGAVGIGSIKELDSVVGTDGKPYWRAQEYGSTHLVGRTIGGLFQPGGVFPSQQEFRKQGVFVVGPGGPMHIQRPIVARGFITHGVEEAALFRGRQFSEAQAVAVAEIRAIEVSLTAL